MTLRIESGQLLIDSGQLANSADCCCGSDVTCTISLSESLNREDDIAVISGYYAINFKGVVVSGPNIKSHSLTGITTDSATYTPTVTDTGWQTVVVPYGTTGAQACVTFTNESDETFQCCVDIPCCYQVNDAVVELSGLPATYNQQCNYPDGLGGTIQIEYDVDGLNAHNGTNVFALISERGPCDTVPAMVLDDAYQFTARSGATTATYEGSLTFFPATVNECLSVPDATRVSGSGLMPASMYLRVADKTSGSGCTDFAECGVTPTDPCNAVLNIRSTTNGTTLLLENGLGTGADGTKCPGDSGGDTFTYVQPYFD